jgi:xanthine dehydrogenase accessory factor
VTRITALHAARAALEALERGEDLVVATLIHPPETAGPRLLIGAGGVARGSLADAELDAHAVALAHDALAGGEPKVHVVEVSAGRRMIYVEAHRAPERLIIVGAGHIAVPLARLGAELGFAVTVLDDREEFATVERFAPGVRVIRADFAADPFAGVPINPRSYVALVTRGHKWDFDCLRRMLDQPRRPRYLGMIGSRRRVRAAFGALLDAGVPREELARIHAPIGLEIGAETPEEIAVSIAAELVQVRRGATVASLTAKERVLEKLLPEDGDRNG